MCTFEQKEFKKKNINTYICTYTT